MPAEVEIELRQVAGAIDPVLSGAHDVGGIVDPARDKGRLRIGWIIVLDRVGPDELQGPGHHAGTVIVMEVLLRREVQVRRQVRDQLGVAEIVGALRVGVVVAVVDRLRLVDEVAARIDVGLGAGEVGIEERTRIGLEAACGERHGLVVAPVRSPGW